jgi:hypothetical protein
MSDLADLYSALDSARTVMALSSQDWGVSSDFAWLWGILVGWDAEPDDSADEGAGDAMAEVAARHRWSADDVARLRRLRAAVVGFDISRIAELEAPR